jgi:hypothetical protein
VAFILFEPQERLFEDPNVSILLHGCTQALAAHDVTLVLVVAGDGAERKPGRTLRHRRARRRRAAGVSLPPVRRW